MNDEVPDRLCAESVSAFHNSDLLEKVEIWIDGVKQDGRVIEYCISGRWARVYGNFGKIKKLMRREIRVEFK